MDTKPHNTTPLLQVRDLTTTFPAEAGPFNAVDGVSFTITRGEILGLVGESGCGKSMTALSIIGLVPEPGRITGGRVLFEGTDLAAMPAQDLRRIRGERISMVFQEPMSALNPVFTVGDQIAEVLRVHRGLGRGEALEAACSLLERVGIPDPARRVGEYPHQMSGGMQQRALIAMAMACEPDLLLADEPTTALDVTVQAQILGLMEHLIRDGERGGLMITHDLGVIAQVADRVCVMYAGVIVEQAAAGELFGRPAHPYTIGLLGSLPTPGRRSFTAIPGNVPDPVHLPSGCRFAPRCPRVRDRCREAEPPLEGADGRRVRCYYPD